MIQAMNLIHYHCVQFLQNLYLTWNNKKGEELGHLDKVHMEMMIRTRGFEGVGL